MESSQVVSLRPGLYNPPIQSDLYIACRLDTVGSDDRDCPSGFRANNFGAPRPYTFAVTRLPFTEGTLGMRITENVPKTRGYYVSFNYYLWAYGFPNYKLGGALRDGGRFHVPGGPIHSPRFKCGSDGSCHWVSY
jgi:hypothetical protein